MTSFFLATFSVDGEVIYAINYHQELFTLDPLKAQIISKRKIDEIGDISSVIPTQMMQVTPEIMVIGSMCKAPQEQLESSTPYLLILSGDLLDPQAKLKLVRFKMNLLGRISPEKLPDFRFHYVKERYCICLYDENE